jgi:hypothetical protein
VLVRKTREIQPKGKAMWGFYQSAEATYSCQTAQLEGAQPETSAPKLKKDWQYYSGMTALVMACVLPLLSLAIPCFGLPTRWSVALAATLIAGGPEVLLVIAAVLLGKETVHYFLSAAKRWVFRVLWLEPAAR